MLMKSGQTAAFLLAAGLIITGIASYSTAGEASQSDRGSAATSLPQSAYATQVSRECLYPTPEAYDDEAILNRSIWNLFVSIDGFNNTPSAGVDFSGGNLSIFLNGSDNVGRSVSLERTWIRSYAYYGVGGAYDEDMELVTVRRKSWDRAVSEVVSETTSVLAFSDLRANCYRLTAFLDESNILHVFWERASLLTYVDAPNHYWLLYERIGSDSTVSVPTTLFYFDIKGGWVRFYREPLLTTEQVVLVATLAASTIVGVLASIRLTSRGRKEGRSPDRTRQDDEGPRGP